MTNLNLMQQTITVTPEDLFNAVLQIKADLSTTIALIIDPLFNLETPEVFNELYKNDFEKINAALQSDPRALADPEKLKDIPRYTKILFSLIQMQQRLAPPPPGQIEIIKPN